MRTRAGPVPGSPGSGGRQLPPEFFGRPAAVVAPDLLGQVLVHDSPDGVVAAVIVETEAYAGQADPASHAYRGKTARNAVMFGPPGHAYVYFTYGIHCCVNLVCQPDGDASAVLLRAGRVIEGVALAAARRTAPRRPGRPGRAGIAERELARGPGSLCQALGIDLSMDGADVCAAASPLRAEPGDGAADGITAGPRVGVSSAAEVPWRFWLTGEPSVSAYRSYPPRRAPAKLVSGQVGEDGTMPR